MTNQKPRVSSRAHAVQGQALLTSSRYGRYLKKWHIRYNPKPIPSRNFDWDWWHDDFDGAPEGPDEGCRDPRCGAAGSITEAIEQIDELIEELNEGD